jgi:hypothetical protein
VSRLTPPALRRFREEYEEPALLVASVVGVVAAALHPYGLVLGGLLVGLVSPTFWRAISAGLALGVLTLLVFAGVLAWNGTLLAAAGLRQVTLLAVVLALLFPTAAAGAVRGLL